MPSAIRTNDILWTRDGAPVLVNKYNEMSNEVVLDDKIKNVQEASKNGIKNGLSQPAREAYNATLSSVQNMDKKQEIRDLYQKIKNLKEGKTDPRLVKYLESELQFKIIREDFKPEDYAVNPITLDIS